MLFPDKLRRAAKGFQISLQRLREHFLVGPPGGVRERVLDEVIRGLLRPREACDGRTSSLHDMVKDFLSPTFHISLCRSAWK